MLFNSYVFILVYLPLTLGIFFALGHRGSRKLAIGWLVMASLAFYSWWDARYLALIVASILANYLVGTLLGDTAGTTRTRKRILAAGVAANLLVLGYYKYFDFFIESANSALGTALAPSGVVLPLGISFFTFTQIAFLVDAYRGEVREYDLTRYSLFVTYFPHLIAGPVLHHKEMMPQFANPSIFRFDARNFSAGITCFALGLFKKTVIADSLALHATPVFAAAQRGDVLTTADAWGGALAYTFQLYFDFSGYSDMAIGLALMMGVRLPLNFDSPYKATSIIDFWRRWHMTLSRFLRDYLYIALGGNRKGEVRRYLNLFLTMLLGGIWHGAGWTFVIWGALHGSCLVINHGWQAWRRKSGWRDRDAGPVGKAAAWLLTFLAVVIGWVYFRAADVATAHSVLGSMFTPSGWQLSGFFAAAVMDTALGRLATLAGLEGVAGLLLAAVLAAALAICLLAPNTQEIMGRHYWTPHGTLEPLHGKPEGRWRPDLRWASVAVAAGTASLLQLSAVSEFLYFQF